MHAEFHRNFLAIIDSPEALHIPLKLGIATKLKPAGLARHLLYVSAVIQVNRFEQVVTDTKLRRGVVVPGEWFNARAMSGKHTMDSGIAQPCEAVLDTQ